MAVCLVIPARYASSRLPGKALAEVGGVPLIAHLWRAVAGAPGFARTLVATDDERIAAAARAAGAPARDVVMTSRRPRNGTERVAEIAGTAALDVDADVFVNVQGDQLGVTHALLATLLRALDEDDSAPLATLATVERGDDPATRAAFAAREVVKVVTDAAGRALYFSRAPIPHGRDVWLRHVGVYAYRRDALLELAAAEPTPLERAEGLEQLRALEMGLPIRVALTAERPLSINVPADLGRIAASATGITEEECHRESATSSSS
jgi:3-deoxy-manno-octulosonate cytidylyltransferase (CMP-KDO synthetase)